MRSRVRAVVASVLAAVLVASGLAATVLAQERIPGGSIRDRIRERMEQRRGDRVPPLGSASKIPDGGPGYESVLIRGQARTFMRYTPNSVLVSGKRAPVVFALHGATGTADRLQGYLRMNAIADREGFVVVYPQGEGRRWNDGRTPDNGGGGGISQADDVAFLNGLADALVAQGVADPQRLYIMGLSNGGYMTLALACSGQSRFAAFGVVIASLPRAQRDACKPELPLRLVMMNGTEDKLIRFDGGVGRYGIRGNLPPPEAAAYLAEKAGCPLPTESTLAKRVASDPTAVAKRVWGGCEGGGSVVFITVKGGGHNAPVAANVKSSVVLDVLAGTRSHQIDTAETMWEFFKGTPVR